ncbi:MAG: EpsI family protein [Planctomycetes bacterium]|nr:EpsI family protein [Planctomycetota bacterium]
MTKSDNSNRKSVAGAAVAAGLVIIVFSAAYSVLAARLETPMNITLLTSAALELLPLEIGGWTGQEVPLDEKVVRATDTDAHINRIYSRRNETEHVSLYIAYGGRARDLMPHRPEVCYTGAGWTRIDRRSMELPLSDEMELPCNIFQFSRGTLNTKKTVLLNYYIVDGQYCRDVSGLRFKAWRGSGTVRYVAQVQIVTSTSVNLNASSAEKIVCSFAAESASSISRLFESTEDTRFSDEARFDPKRIFGGTGSDE